MVRRGSSAGAGLCTLLLRGPAACSAGRARRAALRASRGAAIVPPATAAGMMPAPNHSLREQGPLTSSVSGSMRLSTAIFSSWALVLSTKPFAAGFLDMIDIYRLQKLVM